MRACRPSTRVHQPPPYLLPTSPRHAGMWKPYLCAACDGRGGSPGVTPLLPVGNCLRPFSYG